MRVAVLQSCYLPWKGYFDIIAAVDLFIFYDDVQFTKNDWRNRNQIKTQAGKQWISIPVGTDLNRLIQDVALTDPTWQAKHWATLKQNYGKAPQFAALKPFLEEVYLGTTWTNLSALNQFLTERIARDFLGLTTRFERSSQYQLQGIRQERLLDLLRQVGATWYLSGPSGAAYLDAGLFRERGIELAYQSYQGYPEYPQFHPPFEHGVSIVDLLFQVGTRAPEFIWGWRSGQGQVRTSP